MQHPQPVRDTCARHRRPTCRRCGHHREARTCRRRRRRCCCRGERPTSTQICGYIDFSARRRRRRRGNCRPRSRSRRRHYTKLESILVDAVCAFEGVKFNRRRSAAPLVMLDGPRYRGPDGRTEIETYIIIEVYRMIR